MYSSGQITKIQDARNYLRSNGIRVVKSDLKDYSWFVPDTESDLSKIGSRQVGQYLTDDELISYANEMQEEMVYAKGGKTNKSAKADYMVFNYTDNIYASNEVFKTKKEANEFIRSFRNRFKSQGYYRDNRLNKIPVEEIDLLIIPSNFSPYTGKTSEIFDLGGKIEDHNAQMLYSQIKEIQHHAEEIMKVINENTRVDSWVVAKGERSSTDLSDITHYLSSQTDSFCCGGSLAKGGTTPFAPKMYKVEVLYTDGANFKNLLDFEVNEKKAKEIKVGDEVTSEFFGISEKDWFDNYLTGDYDPEFDHNTVEIRSINEIMTKGGGVGNTKYKYLPDGRLLVTRSEINPELKRALSFAEGSIFSQDFLNKYDIIKETYSTLKYENAKELAENRRKQLKSEGYAVKIRKVSFVDLARGTGYFLTAVKRKFAKGGGVGNFSIVKVKFADPQYDYKTSINPEVSEEEVRKYFVGAMFDMGVFPVEDMQEVIDIEFYPAKQYAYGGETDFTNEGAGMFAKGGTIKQNEGKLFNEKGEMLVYKKQSDTSIIYDVDVYEPRKTDVEEYSKFKYCKREKNGRECVYRLDKKALIEMIKKEKFIYSKGGGVNGNIKKLYAEAEYLFYNHISNGGKLDFSEKNYGYLMDELDMVDVGYFAKPNADSTYANELREEGFTMTEQEAIDLLTHRINDIKEELEEYEFGGAIVDYSKGLLSDPTFDVQSADFQMKEGGSVGKELRPVIHYDISQNEIDQFIDSVYNYYKEVGYTRQQVKSAVNKYLRGLGKQLTWNNGSKLDRDRVYEYLKNPTKVEVTNPTKRYSLGGNIDDLENQAYDLAQNEIDSLDDMELASYLNISYNELDTDYLKKKKLAYDKKADEIFELLKDGKYKRVGFGVGSGKYEGWELNKGDNSIRYNGKLITRYMFDRDTNSFWIDKCIGGGSKSFDSPEEIFEYYAENYAEQISKLAEGGQLSMFEDGGVLTEDTVGRVDDQAFADLSQYAKGGKTEIRYARRCDATGRGINQGYVVGDGELYFSKEEHLIAWLKGRGGMEGLSDEFILDEAYKLGEYYYTEWDESEIEEQGYYYTADGQEIGISAKGGKTAEYFFIDGYYKDDGTEFEDYVVKSTHDVVDGKDDDVFFFGLSENEIKNSIGKEDGNFDFVITGYRRV